ncbi:hypothetical protein TB1_001311 [Malus domestica]
MPFALADLPKTPLQIPICLAQNLTFEKEWKQNLNHQKPIVEFNFNSPKFAIFLHRPHEVFENVPSFFLLSVGFSHETFNSHLLPRQLILEYAENIPTSRNWRMRWVLGIQV